MSSPVEYPLHWPEGWPRSRSRRRAAFSSKGTALTYTRAEERLRNELKLLAGGGRYSVLIISTNMIRERQPSDPGAAVYFQMPDGPMRVMAADIYDRVEDNIGALAATVEAMRAIQRHGGATILERAFTGFTALPAPKSCWAVLGVPPGSTEALVRDAYRRAAKALHDRQAPEHQLTDLNVARDEALAQVKGIER
jgi:hypothetical protein